MNTSDELRIVREQLIKVEQQYKEVLAENAKLTDELEDTKDSRDHYRDLYSDAQREIDELEFEISNLTEDY